MTNQMIGNHHKHKKPISNRAEARENLKQPRRHQLQVCIRLAKKITRVKGGTRHCFSSKWGGGGGGGRRRREEVVS